MLEPPIPEQENLRLATLRNLDVLDSPAEECYDRLTRIAKKLFDVPIVVVSLVDSKRQWFKSKIGVDAEELPRRTSFCGHAILQKHAFVVNDTRNDPRFVDNPLVTGQPFIRFYAAQPLQATNGMMIGTLCIIDDKPREFEAEDVYLLKDLAVQVEMVLNNPDLQRMTTSLMKSEKRLLETIYLLEKKRTARTREQTLPGNDLTRRTVIGHIGSRHYWCRTTKSRLSWLYIDNRPRKQLSYRQCRTKYA